MAHVPRPDTWAKVEDVGSLRMAKSTAVRICDANGDMGVSENGGVLPPNHPIQK